MRRIFVCLIAGMAVFCGPRSSLAQAKAPVAPESTPVVTAGPDEPSRREALAAISRQIEELQRQIEDRKKSIAASPSDDERGELYAQLKDLDRQLEAAKIQLIEVVATNVDLSGFQTVEEKPFTLQGAMEDLVRPLIEEVRHATADSREAQALRAEFDDAKQRAAVIRAALSALDKTIAETRDAAILKVLNGVRQEFRRRYEEVTNRISVLGYQLDEFDKEKKSFVGETRGLIASFFRNRGRNLLIALFVAAAVFLGLRYLHRYLHTRTPVFRKGRAFPTRVLDVALAIFTFLGALIGAIIVLLIAGDWVLLGLVALLLIAVVLAAKDALPGYMDEVRLMLNIGPVREGERIIYDGVPWNVENLSFATILRNSSLRGGMLRMPIASMKSMISRPTTDREPYFPCEEGDWVLLDDGVYGRVIFQSVEMVRLVLLGGAQKTYPTASFLSQNPQNHSHGFRIKTTIGIDYDHQPGCTTDILEKLRAYFDRAVHEAVDREHVKSLKVEFEAASASSLDYAVLLDLDGELASRLNPLTRTLQCIGVDACNEFGLVIPFQQVTIHQASGS